MKKYIPLYLSLFLLGIFIYSIAPRTTTIHAELPLYNINELVDSSDLIVYGEVVHINESKWSNPDKTYGENIRNDITTDYVFKIKNIYYGEKIDKEITVRSFIGTVDRETWISDDYPSFTEGEEAILFLRNPNPMFEPINENYYLPVGMIQGKFSTKSDPLSEEALFSNGITEKKFKLSSFENEIKDIVKYLEKNPITKYSQEEVEVINREIFSDDSK